MAKNLGEMKKTIVAIILNGNFWYQQNVNIIFKKTTILTDMYKGQFLEHEDLPFH